MVSDTKTAAEIRKGGGDPSNKTVWTPVGRDLYVPVAKDGFVEQSSFKKKKDQEAP